MNKSTAIFLARDDIRCVSVSYDVKGHDYKGKPIPTDIKSFKTASLDIAKDDLVVIPCDTRWGFTVGKVVDVDLHVDYDSSEQMRWIVSRIDTDEFESMLAAEAKMIDVVADADRGHRREELRAKIFANVDSAKLQAIGMDPGLKSGSPAPAPHGQEPDKRGGAQPRADD